MGIDIEKITLNYDDGSYAESYHKKGKKTCWHREDGPAFIYYNKDGSVYREEYWVNDKLHKEDGPTIIMYNKDGSIDYEEYRINGKKLSKEEWERDYGWKKQLKGTPMGEIYGN